MERVAFFELAEKISKGTATDLEVANYNAWYTSFATESHWDETSLGNREQKEARLLHQIEAGIKSNNIRRLWPRIAAAASIILCLSGSIYFLLRKPAAPEIVINPVKNHVVPGSNKAVLTLANGTKIVLNDAQTGKLAVEGNTYVNKTADGQLVYKTGRANLLVKTGEYTVYNTIATPRGGQYWITLPDGSKVLLNAASSLKYPTAFTQKERKVELTGEAYFEVAKNPEKPFRVDVDGKQEIEVLGTHFDIKAYADDRDISTTLLEGSVKLTYQTRQVILKPGQIAVNNLAGSLLVKTADIDEVMAWKNGLFVFNDENIKNVLRIAARWYDVDVEYKGDISQKRLRGTISKYKNITELLDNITIISGIHYKIEGRRVIVMN